jgi:tetratricopeptide (TPR) repeat protein
MGLIPTIELRRPFLFVRDERAQPRGWTARLIDLSSWMMVLGTIRLICSFADYASVYLEATRIEPMTSRRLAWFLQENHPIVAFSAAWPLVLAFALRRTRWLQLLKAVAVTFLILSIGGVLALTADLNQSREKWITLGSFHVSRGAFLHPGLSDVILGLLGMAQLAAEFWTAVRAIQLALQAPLAPVEQADKQGIARRARFGRLAIYGSAAYLILMIRLPVWSAYLEVLNQSQFVREFILQNDFQRIRSVRRTYTLTPEAERTRDLDLLLAGGTQAWGSGRFLEARDYYVRLVSALELIPPTSLTTSGRHTGALGLNNLAWLLATCPDVAVRDPRAAVGYAQRGLGLEPNDGNTWNTLGVAYYRIGDWEESQSALKRSMELRNEGDGFDWFFLAMIHAKLGHPERAREWYDKATRWSHQFRPGDPELYLFQVEAAAILGLPQPPGPPPRPPEAVRPPSQGAEHGLIPTKRGRLRVIDRGLRFR